MKKLPALLISCACLFSTAMVATPAHAQVLTQGMQNEQVSQVQEQLASRGYFHVGVTGYYGTITSKAVKNFQRDYGLVADGVAGPATIAKLNSLGKVSNHSLNMLAKIIYAEARGESFRGQVAVGAVVLNRVQSNQFPNSISAVILQPGQFTAVQDGQYGMRPNQTAYDAARQALNGVDPTNGSLYYYNPKIATSSWSIARPKVISLGQHTFTN